MSACFAVLNLLNSFIRQNAAFCRNKSTSTIYALSSGAVRSALATIRVSGPNTASVLRRMARIKRAAPRKALLRRLIHPKSGVHLDTAIVIWFPSPRSYTGEDCCELHVHGGAAVVNGVLKALSEMEDLRQAQPGEFTQRAFLNGKMDLAEVEGLADLLQAETEAQRMQALAQMEGNLSKLYRGWMDNLKKCLANIEAFIDFSEDQGIDEAILGSAAAQAERLAKEIQDHLSDGRRGERLRSGVKVAIVGRTNVGKSSLFNALCRRDAAIVSPIAGTTRDVVESPLDIGGYPAVFCDTAGLRTSEDPVETEGVLRARRWASAADLALVVADCRELLCADGADSSVEAHLDQLGVEPCPGGLLFVLNKTDLLSQEDRALLRERLAGGEHDCVFTSCATHEGIADLVARLAAKLEAMCRNPADASPALTQERHRHHLRHCLESLGRFGSHVHGDAVVAAEHLRLALAHLGRITGKVFSEEILDVIFRDFCIGK
ncbi:tRNA modification GTPase GTPBP3, mitochondrial [Ixodes scapularis]